MVAAARRIDAQPWSYALAPRSLADRRSSPCNDYILFDGDGRPLGLVRGATGEPLFGPHAPEMFLLRGDE